MNSPPSNELKYSQIFFRVIKQHLQEHRCNHSIFQIAIEADCEANKTINSEANKGSKNGLTQRINLECYAIPLDTNMVGAQTKSEASDDTTSPDLRLGGDDNE